jgi:hypothetical protein
MKTYVHLYIAELFLESEIFRMRVVEKIKAHILRIITFHENRALCEIMWKTMVQPTQATDDYEILRMLFACWIIKTTVTHSEYVILIDCPLQKWLSESTSILCCMYVASLIVFNFYVYIFVAAHICNYPVCFSVI